MNNILINSRWSYSSDLDIDGLWSLYLKNIRNAMNLSIPFIRKKRWSPLNNSMVRSLLRQHRRIFRRFSTAPNLSNKLLLMKSQDRIDTYIKEYISKYERKLSLQLKNNPKPFWCYVNSSMKDRPSMSTFKDDDGNILDDSLEIAEAFNDLFTSFFFKNAYVCPVPREDTTSLDQDMNTISTVSFAVPKIRFFIDKLPASVSCDRDGISYKTIKSCNSVMASKLSHLFQKSMDTGLIPDSWRNVIVTPIYKSGDKQSLSNYRPITISSCILRLMERVIADELLQFLITNNILSNTQHGFIKGRSVESAGVCFYDYVTRQLDTGMCVDTIFLDYSRAFDSVPHQLLLEKLRQVGICGQLLQWLNNYFTRRFQCVRINNVTSSFKAVDSGVMQGSVLGPLLFLLYIDDVDSCTNGEIIVKYADDVKLAASFDPTSPSSTESVTTTLQRTITSIDRWSVIRGLHMNINKSKSMQFGHKNGGTQYCVRDLPIENVDSFKDLGVTVSLPMSFGAHISGIVAKANQSLGIMSKFFKTKTPEVLLPIYKSIIRSTLEYGSIIWSPQSRTLCFHIERVQKRFTRLFPHVRNLQYKERLNVLSIYSLETRRLRYRLIYLFKIVHHMTPLDPNDYFEFSSRAHRENPYKLIMPLSRHVYSTDTRFLLSIQLGTGTS